MQASKTEVERVPTPLGTDTWYPIAHATIIQTVEDVLAKRGIQIAKEHYELSRDGQRAIGVVEFVDHHKQSQEGHRAMLAWRNSHNKRHSVGFAAGDKVLACLNMMISSKFMEYRRHTSRMDFRLLESMVNRAVTKTVNDNTRIEELYEVWQQLPMTRKDVNDFGMRLAQYQILPWRTLPAYVKALDTERDLCKRQGKLQRPSLYNAFAGATRVMKEMSLTQMADRSRHLCSYTVQYMRFLDPGIGFDYDFEQYDPE